MANKITEECMSCGACESECPNQAIAQGDDHFEIDAVKCDECGKVGGKPRCIEACPTEEAIVKA